MSFTAVDEAVEPTPETVSYSLLITSYAVNDCEDYTPVIASTHIGMLLLQTNLLLEFLYCTPLNLHVTYCCIHCLQ